MSTRFGKTPAEAERSARDDDRDRTQEELFHLALKEGDILSRGTPPDKKNSRNDQHNLPPRHPTGVSLEMIAISDESHKRM